MWPYYAPIFANFLLLFYESKCFKSIKNTNHGVARTFGNIFRFIDGLMAMNVETNLKIITMKSTCPN